ncbi:NAD(P) transhydrogenase subunit alpha [Kribbella shirazensis]|uniref:proton-translocating NAD(P)(+) transhydrogenase n=1 Tax=Kribbella shirazensis TaxID=1105143 RepID=A0A7X6A2B3_9ACTN|nr:NAD(P) transhydrogenase subunit alpha [Kribbella shirazensis]
MTMMIGCPAETEWHERRVAVTPDVVARLRRTGLDVMVEAGAGRAAGFPDEAYVAAGARIASRSDVFARSDILAVIHRPDCGRLRAGQIVIGLLRPYDDPAELAGVTALSFEGLPRTLDRARPMDVLASQASVAGYKAAVLAADTFGGFFPAMTTAGGTARPARVLVLGGGVAGPQAMATARRLGASVTAYDVCVVDAGRDEQRASVAAIRDFDVVITTAQVAGQRPQELVPAATLAALAPGSVVVDLAAGPLGGNVAGSVPDGRTETDNGVIVLGAGNLPAQVPRAASSAWACNVAALLEYLMHNGSVVLDPDDEITAGLAAGGHQGRRRRSRSQSRRRGGRSGRRTSRTRRVAGRSTGA